MTLNRMHNCKADVSRMYISRKEGERGMACKWPIKQRQLT